MNAARRKELEKADGLIHEAMEILSSAASEEQDYYDNMPEGFQNGDKGEAAQAAASALEECDGLCEEILAKIEEAKGA
jgi:hypothetical protein